VDLIIVSLRNHLFSPWRTATHSLTPQFHQYQRNGQFIFWRSTVLASNNTDF